ncbi:MAG: hypothetical protein GY754_15675 [bacterium]|nr:hypothetical protein [bacterium]
MALSKTEIDRLLSKLRDQYTEYEEKYNKTWFNRDGFENRYIMAIRNKMNLEGFILAEIANIEKIKTKYDSAREKQEKSFSKKVDGIIEENIARIKKYPEILFHSHAGVEIVHLYGAMAEFTLHYFAVLWILAEDKSLKDLLINFEDHLSFLAVPRGTAPAKRIEDHMFILSRLNIREIEIEKDKTEYLKESAFVLHEIIDLCDGLIDSKESAWELPLRFNKLYLEEKRKRQIVDLFSGLTGYGAIFKIREYASGIIEDFRLQAFRRQEQGTR